MATVFGRNSVQRFNVGQSMLSDAGPGMHPRVSILGSQFTLIDEAGTPYNAPCILRNQKMALLAIIIGSNPKRSRIFYERDYDPVNPGPPDCYSDNGIAPSVSASDPQARTCLECEWSKWGSDISAITGKKIKACSEKRKIAMLIVGDSTQRVYELQVPPKSLKNMGKFASLCSQHSPPGESRKGDVSDYITAISFASGQVGVLEFEPFSWISSAYRDGNGTIMVTLDPRGAALDAPDGGEAVGAMIDDIWDGDTLPTLLGLTDQPWTPPHANVMLPGMKGATEPVPHSIAHQPAQAPGTAPFAGSPFEAPAGRAPAQAASPFQNPNPAPAADSRAQTPPQQQLPAAVPARSRGRPRKDAAGAAGGQPSQAPFLGSGSGGSSAGAINPAPAATGGDIPDFLRRAGVSNDQRGVGGPVHVPTGPALQPAGRSEADRTTNESGAFGMVDAAAPPTELAKTLGGVFALPIAR